MDFFVNNYVWFIIGGVVILMAIIGYIADKTDFGRKGKEEKPKVEKPKKEKEKKEKIKVEAKGINELTQEVTKNNNLSVQENKETGVIDPIQSSQAINENINQDLFAPLTDNPNENTLKTNETVENIELKNVEPSKLENPTQDGNQVVTEDDDIWKF